MSLTGSKCENLTASICFPFAPDSRHGSDIVDVRIVPYSHQAAIPATALPPKAEIRQQPSMSATRLGLIYVKARRLPNLKFE